jgi:tRNA modification GTPase
MDIDTTIVAPATGNISSALGIIRVSGKKAVEIVNKVFLSIDYKKDIIKKAKKNTAHFGIIVKDNKKKKKKDVIDEVVCTVFLSPYSYTGEDTIEISHHGSIFIQSEIIKLLIDCGCTMAKRGEFTQRAFLNGKMNLSQAEAVADLIASRNQTTHLLAYNQLRGGYNEELQKLRERFLKISSLLELELDFTEDNEVFVDRKVLKDNILMAKKTLSGLVDSFSSGNAFKNGVPVAIVGKPNSGKSTLLNTLLNEQRAIVSQIEGTTRDTIEEVMTIDGVDFRFIDTAGLREGKDEIEKEGIKRSLEATKKAQIILYLVDISKKNTEIIPKDLNFGKEKQVIFLLNKNDKSVLDENTTKRLEEEGCMFISALKKEGISDLKQKIRDIVKVSNDSEKVLVSNIRHYEIMKKALSAINDAKFSLENNVPSEFIAEDVRRATTLLGEILGEVTNDEVLGNIFSKFCIGK